MKKTKYHVDGPSVNIELNCATIEQVYAMIEAYCVLSENTTPGEFTVYTQDQLDALYLTQASLTLDMKE